MKQQNELNALSKIVLVDDHVVMRNGLKELLELRGGYNVVAQYRNGIELLDSLPFAETPSLIIMDLSMPGMGGEETIQRLKAIGIDVPILILTLSTKSETIVTMYKGGVHGYVEKDATTEELLMAVQSIVLTGYFQSPLLLKALASQQGKVTKAEVMTKITSRELSFLHLICDEAEYTYEQIADMLGVSVRTVDGYRESIFQKFDIKSKPGLVLFSLKYGLTGLNSKYGV